MTRTKTLLALALAGAAIRAQAYAWSITGGAYSGQSGPFTMNLSSMPAPATGGS